MNPKQNQVKNVDQYLPSLVVSVEKEMIITDDNKDKLWGIP
jgi:hypothetical protein